MKCEKKRTDERFDKTFVSVGANQLLRYFADWEPHPKWD